MRPELAAIAFGQGEEMIVMGREEDAPAIDHGRIDDGRADILAPDALAGLGIHGIGHAEAGGDEELALVIGDAAAHAADRLDGVGFAEQAPQGGHVGAVLGRQALVP